MLPADMTFPYPCQQNRYLVEHIQLLCDSLRALTGRNLVEPGLDPVEAARHIFHAPFVVLSHNTGSDPVLTYANLAGLDLFELNWDQLVITPSRNTAEIPVRAERERLLEKVATNGFISDYAGVRVAKSGRRFRIANATVWNLQDAQGIFHGQAATFNSWIFLQQGD